MNKPLFNSLLILFLFSFSCLTAQWQPTGFNQSTWVLCKASNGNLIATNDVYPEMGGVFLSEDQGETWSEASVEPHSYTSHLVDGENIYLGGVQGNIAISNDNGHTWSQTSFADLFPGITEFDPIYAIESHNNRIYAAVLAFGIVYSEDGGMTWQLTDRESLLDPDDPDNGGQWCYNLRSFNGKLYNLGAFGIWEYDETDDVWSQVDPYWYAGDSIIVDDVLYVVYNAFGLEEGIRFTSDFQNWESMAIGDLSTSNRFLEYYNGAFFLGNVEEAIFYTLDHGNTWTEYREDFPMYSPAPGVEFYGTPMNLVFMEDTMYVGVFSNDPELQGVYRAPIPEELLQVNSAEIGKTVLFPNPADDFISFRFDGETMVSGILRITDVMGRIVYQEKITSQPNNTHTLSVASWPSGIYLYSIEGKNTTTSGKFLIR